VHGKHVAVAPLLVALSAVGCGLPGLPVPVGEGDRIVGGGGWPVGALSALPAERLLEGTVTVRGAAGEPHTVRVGSDGAFTLRVRAGVYTVTGRSPLYESGAVNCHAAGPVTVRTGVTSRVPVMCRES
jgi:hypothetical protein